MKFVVLFIIFSIMCACTSEFEQGTISSVSADVMSAETSVDHEATSSNPVPNVCEQSACDDGNACTLDTCLETGCAFTPNTGVACDDNNACTMSETCESNGWCVLKELSVCDDDNLCTLDTCDFTKGCSHAFNQSPCNDHDACTQNDVCAQGACMGTNVSCEDNNPCTIDACNKKYGCDHNASTVCNDNDPWTHDSCNLGGCKFQPIEVLIEIDLPYKQFKYPQNIVTSLFIEGMQIPSAKGDDVWTSVAYPSGYFVNLKQLCTQWTQYIPADQLKWNAGYRIFENGFFVKNEFQGSEHVKLQVAVSTSSWSHVPLGPPLKLVPSQDDPNKSGISPELGKLCADSMKTP